MRAWLNGRPEPKSAHRLIVAAVVLAGLLALVHQGGSDAQCVYSGAAWFGC